ncbi:kinase-like domain-containing protein [Panaeolus papilionaceus]|nr:kinase-like domain-containing protein [Panaeolus papilionaceus]
MVDGRQVVVKYVDQDYFPFERDITAYFSSKEQRSKQENHCVELIDVLYPPPLRHSGQSNSKRWNVVFLVLPLLRPVDSPPFDTFGEAIDFFRQLFEGIQFMHQHRVAHRDITFNNVMLDPSSMFPEGFHPCSRYKRCDGHGMAKRYTRTTRPPRYVLIGFGLSHHYKSAVSDPLLPVVHGGDATVPEFRGKKSGRGKKTNPFQTDIYYAGNLIRQVFDKPSSKEMVSLWGPGFHGFRFMRHLIEKMVQDDPTKRPTIEQVVEDFELIVKELSSWKLRSRMRARKVTDDPYYWFIDQTIYWMIDPTIHWMRRIKSIALRRPAIQSFPRDL